MIFTAFLKIIAQNGGCIVGGKTAFDLANYVNVTVTNLHKILENGNRILDFNLNLDKYDDWFLVPENIVDIVIEQYNEKLSLISRDELVVEHHLSSYGFGNFCADKRNMAEFKTENIFQNKPMELFTGKKGNEAVQRYLLQLLKISSNKTKVSFNGENVTILALEDVMIKKRTRATYLGTLTKESEYRHIVISNNTLVRVNNLKPVIESVVAPQKWRNDRAPFIFVFTIEETLSRTYQHLFNLIVSSLRLSEYKVEYTDQQVIIYMTKLRLNVGKLEIDPSMDKKSIKNIKQLYGEKSVNEIDSILRRHMHKMCSVTETRIDLSGGTKFLEMESKLKKITSWIDIQHYEIYQGILTQYELPMEIFASQIIEILENMIIPINGNRTQEISKITAQLAQEILLSNEEV